MSPPQAPPRPPQRPPVVLLHGLARTHLSMAGLARALRREGYDTWARTYPSRRLPVGELADVVAGWIHDAYGDQPVHAVTHSLGGILVREMAPRLNLARVVMLAPPNTGSELALRLQDFGPFSLLYGPAGQDVAQQATPNEPTPPRWPRPDVPVAVIAGTRSPTLSNPVSWLSGGLGVFGRDRPNDGTVAVDETRLAGTDAFVEVDASHTWIMNHPQVRAAIVAYLDGAPLPGAAPREGARP